ncbi:hypothetical protein Barb4_01807 [Bacteroidales bacterium Barb4]|nr:hypothetical protein Barb4_01807 [Bacteroidales bacterium Barb4]
MGREVCDEEVCGEEIEIKQSMAEAQDFLRLCKTIRISAIQQGFSPFFLNFGYSRRIAAKKDGGTVFFCYILQKQQKLLVTISDFTVEKAMQMPRRGKRFQPHNSASLYVGLKYPIPSGFLHNIST